MSLGFTEYLNDLWPLTGAIAKFEELDMIRRNSHVLRKTSDYIAIPVLGLLILGYGSLIYMSRSYLGTGPTIVLMGLAVIALLLLARLVIHSRNLPHK